MTDDNRNALQKRIEREISAIEEQLGKEPGLTLSREKTEILMLRRRGQQYSVADNVDDRATSSLKYLGVWLDPDLSWGTHCEKMSARATEVMAKLSAICRNTYGYSSRARKIILEGTEGAASAAFAHKMGKILNATPCERAHRKMLLCYGRLYRTVSYLPATIICGTRPIKYDKTIRAYTIAEKRKLNLSLEDMLLKKPTG
jgi:hypothetical protein